MSYDVTVRDSTLLLRPSPCRPFAAGIGWAKREKDDGSGRRSDKWEGKRNVQGREMRNICIK